MNTTAFLQMDIFFVVTTVVVALIGIFGSVLAYYLIQVVRDIREVTRTIRESTEDLADDVRAVHTDIRETVGEVRESVTSGVKAAKSYSKALAGAGLVRAVAHLYEELNSEKASAESRPPKRRSRKSAKGE